MHKTLHVETHFEATDTVRDVVIGMSDGLTVPFALAAGLTGTAMATTSIVVIADHVVTFARSICRRPARAQNGSPIGRSSSR